ncbi:RidA family protein [Sphingopyxis flava]|uniref:Enamine deaminase RidA, house cleaning of reactive enamine intermediates, YjgF/YER057c/UK114 family n=1 Tax=Sphingopyxis flava TaxID=1507287 RepID=A0A1T5AP15_9SPHN|nr:RidA family protein [Sphingopyxis flava]SKB36764.1 Enamine deaminase RidA, house cleaning of reactive enamine intermediates, YjgF/YER057c/UK114 family [Sphingopyxis flava]
MSIERLHSGSRMSQAVIHNGIVYLAGQVGAPGDDAASQTRAVLAQVDRLLAEAGTDKSRLLTAMIWLADMADFGAMNSVWEEWLGGAGAPTRATGEVRLATPDYKVEVIVTAALP